MQERAFILTLLLGFFGGAAGAALGALGGFILFCFCLLAGFAALLLTGNETWLLAVCGSSLLKPSSCFLGGVIACGVARKLGLLRCGKDIGRPLISLRRPSLLVVGGLAGMLGGMFALLFERFLPAGIDGSALTIVLFSLALKHSLDLTESADCAGSSHAVLSPYRFFERLNRPLGKTLLSLGCGLLTCLCVYLLCLDRHAAIHAPLFAFALSGVSLLLLHLGLGLPATHHFTGPAGAIAYAWLNTRGCLPAGAWDWSLFLGWGLLAASLGQLLADLLGSLFFEKGDMHVDPPAMGIAGTSLLFGGLGASLGLFRLSPSLQLAAAASALVLCLGLNLRLYSRKG